MLEKLKIITRESKLAIWQSNYIKYKLKTICKKKIIQITKIKTYGDKNTFIPLWNIGGKGLFIKELEQILIENKADIAIHSIKDMPYIIPKTLNIITITKRNNSRDVFISKNYKNLNKLPLFSTIATTSLRRKLQIFIKRPDLNIIPLRGNIDSRIKKLINNQFNSIILSAAGITRLKFYKYLQTYININDIIPAIGQGAIALEAKKNHITKLQCKKTYKCIYTERYISKILKSSCLSPIGIITKYESKYIFLNAIISNNKKTIIRSSNNTINFFFKNIGKITSQNLIIKGF